jgi:CBS domain-containing protein
MKISDILRHKPAHSGADVVTITPSDTVAALLTRLAEHNVGALVVLEDKRVAGIVSERDVVRRLAEHGAAVLDRPVSEIMTTSVFTCTSNDTVESLSVLMTERRIRHVPVVDNGRLAGIVSIGDVVKRQISRLQEEQAQLEQYIIQG